MANLTDDVTVFYVKYLQTPTIEMDPKFQNYLYQIGRNLLDLFVTSQYPMLWCPSFFTKEVFSIHESLPILLSSENVVNLSCVSHDL